MTTGMILVVDDDASLRKVLTYTLSEAGYEVLEAGSGEEALDVLAAQTPDVVITDLRMKGMHGLDLLAHVKEQLPQTLVVVITAFGSVDSAVKAMKKGAFDYITKPFDRDALILSIRRALRYRAVASENVRLRQELVGKFSFSNIVGATNVMQELFRSVARVAPTDVTVLIEGESGTGKELIAKAMHFNSPRAGRPLVTVNCAAIPPELLESELFGHVKGAFTGAHRDRTGKFELADRGTLFLDEIGDMPPELQVKLLRFLQEKEIDRVGAEEPVKLDVRILAATNQDVERLVTEERFRMDLFYRLSVVRVHVPPLRARKEDIPLLVDHFLQKSHAGECRVLPDALETLKEHHWPGNVRELENVIERALILRGKASEISREDILLDSVGRPAPARSAVVMPEEGLKLGEVERDLIISALRKTAGNQTAAAKLLGITRQTLIYRIRKHNLE